MEINQLLSKFSQGISWNALFYSIYKIFFTSLSFLLYRYLTTHDYSTWANLNSIMYLLLLWIDCGLRKSIPRYAPIFAQSKHQHRLFTTYVIYFQFALLILCLPIFIYCVEGILPIHAPQLVILGALIFIFEGLISLLRLIYHAHFWNKQFNLLNSAILLVEILINVNLVIFSTSSSTILFGILLTKLCSGIIITLVALSWLTKLYNDKNYPEIKPIDLGGTTKGFIKHSAMMGINNNLKSLTERNFLTPLLTYMYGSAQANIFKIANDGALLFYRIAIKTIGTTDTALLAHVQTLPDGKRLLPIAFKQLTRAIKIVCLPLVALVFLLPLARTSLFPSSSAYQAFFIMAIGYLLEMLLSPYERVLETNRNYALLILAYLPYLFMLIILFLFNLPKFLSMLSILFIIHALRLVGSLIMAFFAHKKHNLA